MDQEIEKLKALHKKHRKVCAYRVESVSESDWEDPDKHRESFLSIMNRGFSVGRILRAQQSDNGEVFYNIYCYRELVLTPDKPTT